jgi:hypothetical protein
VEKAAIFPRLLAGRQICGSCYHSIVDNPTPPEEWELQESVEFSHVKELGEHYEEWKVQDLYQKCVKSHPEGIPNSLRPLQAEVVFHLLRGKDVLCILATNYGKSLAQIAPSFIQAKVIITRFVVKKYFTS